MNFNFLTLCSTLFLSRGCICTHVLDLMGVPLSKLHLYKPRKDFTCVDGSVTIPYDWVNDDYCDCPDGTDEPSSSACVNAFFHCRNKGHIPSEIPSSRVNDGICDCCDGSDEFSKIINCTNICAILTSRDEAEIENRRALIYNGSLLRLEMIQRGKEIRSDMLVHLSETAIELKNAIKARRDAKEIKLLWEEKQNEIANIPDQLAEQSHSKINTDITISTLKAKIIFDEMDTNKDSMIQFNEILQKLKSFGICKSKINPSTLEDEVMYMMNMKSELGFNDFLKISWNRFQVFLNMNETASEELRQKVNQILKEEDKDKQENYLDNSIMYDEESRNTIIETTKAREQFEKCERIQADIEDKVRYIKLSLETDYGNSDEFLPLRGYCFSYFSASYNYTLCPFLKILQSQMNGDCEIKLGQWYDWDTLESKHTVMLYDKGEECWNGPKRSAKVNIFCGLKNELFSANEPDKCAYVFNFRTPAACNPDNLPQDKSYIRHDEL